MKPYYDDVAKQTKETREAGRIRAWLAGASESSKVLGWIDGLRRDIRDSVDHHVFSRLNPRQRWLTRHVPRHWADKVTLIPDLLYACVVHYVAADGEDALNTIHWDPKDAKVLRVIYEWAKTGRAAAQQQVDEAYPHISLTGDVKADLNRVLTPADRAAYRRAARLETQIAKKDSQYLTWIVQHHRRLWT